MCTSTRAVIAVCVCARERDARVACHVWSAERVRRVSRSKRHHRVAGHILMTEYRILGIQIAANITRTLCGLRL